MLDLNSSRWSELRHAFGPAQDVPELLRALATESEPRYSRDLSQTTDNPTPWEQVYTKLCHQGSLYSATFAAFPHMVDIAENDGLGKQKETLLLAGEIEVNGTVDDEVPKDLIADFEQALIRVRGWSLNVVRKIELNDRFTLPHLLQSFGALRCPRSIYVQCLDRLIDGQAEIEIDSCPQCDEYILVALGENRLTTVAVDARGHVIEQSARHTTPDRTSYAARFAAGRELLEDSEDPLWSKLDTPDVLAALAVERNDVALANRILDLDSAIVCPHCGLSFEIREGIEDGDEDSANDWPDL
jgi:uncharacterized protein YbaR (Trm112 family)